MFRQELQLNNKFEWTDTYVQNLRISLCSVNANYFMFLCFKLLVVFSLPVTAYHTAHIQTQKRNC
jgi:hypothetical protein